MKKGTHRWRRYWRSHKPLEPGCPICDPDGYLRDRGGIRYLREKSALAADRRLPEAVENQELAA